MSEDTTEKQTRHTISKSVRKAGTDSTSQPLSLTSTIGKQINYNRSEVELTTREQLQSVSLTEENTIFQYPPTIQPERYIPEIIKSCNLSATYVAPYKEQWGRMKRWCDDVGVSATIISSNKESCETFSGDHDKDWKEKVRSICENQDIGLGQLHTTGNLPCQPDCPFTSNSDDHQKYDLLIGHPTNLWSSSFRENRTIYVGELAGDEFSTTISDPDADLTPYLHEETDFSSYPHFIKNRDDSSLRPSLKSLLYDDNLTVERDDVKRILDDNGHLLAKIAYFGLLYNTELNNGWETSYRHTNSRGYSVPQNRYEFATVGPDRWSVCGLDYNRHRVVRNIQEDTIHILRTPDFSITNGIIGLDVEPIQSVWDTCYGVHFGLERILDNSETKTFLESQMNVSVVQTANSLKPYDGRHVTEGRDASVTLWAGIEHGGQPIVISTDHALERYPKKQPELIEEDASQSFQYRNGSQVGSAGSRLIVLHGAPRPKNDYIQMIGALMGQVVPSGTDKNQSFGPVGDEIRHQFMHSRVARMATSFEEQGKGTTIVLNTTAHPEWLWDSTDSSVDVINILPENGYAKRNIFRYLRKQGDNRVTRNEVATGAEVSGNTVRNALKELESIGWVVEHEIDEGRTQYKYEWSPSV